MYFENITLSFFLCLEMREIPNKLVNHSFPNCNKEALVYARTQ